MFTTLKKLWTPKRDPVLEKPAREAYDIWSASYDAQPDNLMLYLDEILFNGLLDGLDLSGKDLIDMGCGTGRHWARLYARSPRRLKGYDVSEGMLSRLLLKYPEAETAAVITAILPSSSFASCDCLVSTLTMAHLPAAELKEALISWAAAVRPGGAMLLTDFHPAILAVGGRRSFSSEGKTLSVVNEVHPLDAVIAILESQGLELIRKEERLINEELKYWYAGQNALAVYERFKGFPVIYGLYLKKRHAVN